MSINEENSLNIEETAVFLKISIATVRNWIKHGYLRPLNRFGRISFDKNEVKEFQKKIINGKVDRLSKRANKITANRKFLPVEYLKNPDNLNIINNIIEFLIKNNIEINLALFIISIKLFYKKNIIKENNIKRIIEFKQGVFTKKNIISELKNWMEDFDKQDFNFIHQDLFDMDIPEENDIIGLLYQSFLLEGKKSKQGMYYTPKYIIDKIAGDYVKKDMIMLDPCCGSGQFLLSFAEYIPDPVNIFGFDIDKTAVRLARINLLLKYKDIEFSPNIYTNDSILNLDVYPLFKYFDIKYMDLIATNPPWGIHYSIMDRKELKEIYPEINSFESFSYFLKRSIEILKEDGVLSFILPESILNVTIHKDIREYILRNTTIEKIYYYKNIFKNVFTPIIRLDLRKKRSKNNQLLVINNDNSYKINQERFFKNNNYIFDIHCNEMDYKIIQKVYSLPHLTLKNNADWCLGIVTGNNKKYVSGIKKSGYEEIIKGKDVQKFKIGRIKNYLQFIPGKFQQMCPEKKFRVKEKLVYRFISKKMIFAYDNSRKLTLNSANILIPGIDDYPIKVIMAFFNSSLYQFIYQKKFFSIKILRSHLESLPLPVFDKYVYDRITGYVDTILNDNSPGSTILKLDDYIYQLFNMSPDEVEYVGRSIN